jgi:hypothetical protein
VIITLSNHELSLLLALSAVEAGDEVPGHISQAQLLALALVVPTESSLVLTPSGTQTLQSLREHLRDDLDLRMEPIRRRS